MIKHLLHDEIRLKLSELIEKALLAAIPETKDKPLSLSTSEFYSLWGKPPKAEMGHYAFPCFQLSKELKLPPPVLAQKLAAQIGESSLVAKVLAAGPYLNVTLTPQGMGDEALNPILQGDFFKRTLCENAPKTMIEYSQPNTHKEMHVGHMRNLALGHCLSLLYRYANYPLITATYPGDVGTHVAKCLWYLKNHFQGEIPSNPKERGAFLGSLYVKSTLFLEDLASNPDETLSVKARQEMGAILKELHQKSGPYYDLWKETREWSIDQMKNIYKWANVNFDQWYFESEVDEESLSLMKKYFKEGKLKESDGAIGMDLSDEGLGFCMLIKSDGNGLYSTKDIELARRKFEDFKIEKNIYVVDVRQAHHFSQVFKVLEKIGFKHAKDCYHLAYDFVELPDGAMSSRKGNVVQLELLISNMVELIKTRYLNQYLEQGTVGWTPTLIEEVANQVALGAINYGMLKIDPQRKIVFDMDEWLKLDGESGPYLQYAYARISSLVDKLSQGLESEPLDWTLMKEKQEILLALELSHFNTIALQAAEGNKPSHLCSYLYDVAKLYNSFYAECSVAHAETKGIGKMRLSLSKATAKVLKEGLHLLGIPCPQRM